MNGVRENSNQLLLVERVYYTVCFNAIRPIPNDCVRRKIRIIRLGDKFYKSVDRIKSLKIFTNVQRDRPLTTRVRAVFEFFDKPRDDACRL